MKQKENTLKALLLECKEQAARLDRLEQRARALMARISKACYQSEQN